MPRAAGLAAAIQEEFNLEPQLIAGGGGIFEVAADGKVIFSKKVVGRFPENEEVLAALEPLLP